MKNVVSSVFFRHTLFLLFSFVLAAQSVAEIRVTNDMAVIEQEIVPGTLLVFDLDNTVIEGIETVACDQWYDYYPKGLVAQGMEDTASVEQGTVSLIKNASWLGIK